MGTIVLSPYQAFQNKYKNNPGDFVRDCIRWEKGRYPADYQLAILDELVTTSRECVRALHGAGKTAIAAWAVHWFALTRDGEDWKIPTTASAWRQLTKFLWPEIHKWARKIRWDKIGRERYTQDELITLELKLATGQAFAVASDNADLIEGAHADHILYIYDEAKAIPDTIFDAAEGAFASQGEIMALAISTPGEPMGRFYDIQSRKAGYEDWRVRKITKEEAIIAERVSKEWCDQRLIQWGVRSAVYQNRVEGEFAATSESGVIPLAYIEAANQRWLEWQDKKFHGHFTGVGVDVGGGGEGSDPSTLAECFDYLKIKVVHRVPRADDETATMEIAGHVAAVLRKYRTGEAIVDTIGIGAGVAHRLAELGLRVRHFVASQGTKLLDRSGEYGFSDWRTAGWWLLREMLEDKAFGICLPPDDDLTGELTCPQYKVVSDGLYQVESKMSIRRRLHRSTDLADAIIHILTGPLLLDEASDAVRITYNPVKIGPDY
jgi:hypothetical protein